MVWPVVQVLNNFLSLKGQFTEVNMNFDFGMPWVLVYANDLSAYVPAEWAQESLAILEENMVAANLVHRDFENLIAEYGDTVNTRRPGQFVSLPKTDNDSVTDQDATGTNVQVVLDRMLHVTFIIKDGQQSKSFKNLVEEFLMPAMLAHGRMIDRIVLGQYSRFLGNAAGHLGTAGSRDSILEARLIMNTNKAHDNGRNLILTPTTETDLLKVDLFTQAQQVGDSGDAVREAYLGRKFGFNTYMCQNAATVATGNTVVTNGAINNASGYAAGTTTITVDGFNAAIPNNSWFTVVGDDTPQRVVSTVGSGTPTSIVFTPGLRHAVVNDASITRYVPGAVNLVAGYAAGYAKEIVVDAFTVAPQVGQFVTFGTTSTSAIYTIVGVTGLVGITLDRALSAALANDDAVNIGPAGNYNFAFHRNAVALVTRPLAMPPEGTGARAAVVNYNGLSIRVVMTYDGQAQGTRVTLDLLCGVQVLDTNLGSVMCG